MTRKLSPATPLLATACALLCFMLVLGYAQAQTTPAAPTIDSVTPGDAKLAVAWTAPSGETGITAYDLRHIETSADESIAANWTVVDNAWTSGTLEYTITGLDNGTQYDVQVRAVNSNGDGTWSATEVGTPALPAPTLDSVRGDDTAVFVSWRTPSGITTGIGAYDVRYIETSADESVDSNWTVVEDAWEDGGGSLYYAITGLTNDTGYDVQVRAVDEDDVDGAWSATTAATPEDHGDSRTDATSVTVGSRVWGEIDPASDEDYFSFTVSASADYWIYTQGDLDTVGELLDSDGDHVTSDDYGGVLPNPDGFFMWQKLQSGTYYVKVTGFGDTDEPYILRVRAFPERTGWPTATDLPLNGSASGTIDPENDFDFFRLQLSEATEIAIRSSGFPDTIGELYRTGSQLVSRNDDGYLPGGSRNFLIRARLAAGTYYLNVSSYEDRSDGPFTVSATAITEPGSTVADAQVLTLGSVGGGSIDPGGDEDYFSLTLDERTHVIVGGVSRETDLSAQLLDSNSMRAPIDSVHFDSRFVFQGTLDAGTYHLKVTGKESTDTGRYTVRAIVEGSYTYFENRCSSISRSGGISDPFYGCQWHLKNDDQFRNSAGQDIRVEEVWPTYTGDGINVAVVDDGMHYTHEDLEDNVDATLNHNYNNDTTDIYDYFEWHGTAVAGLIAAKDNNIGIRGVAPEATIYGYNYLESVGDANRADAMSRNSSVTAVSNNSWGPRDYGEPNPVAQTWEMAVEDGVTNGYGGKGVVYVWSAGNGGDNEDDSNLDEIANYYAIVAACAVGHDDKRSDYSEPGVNLWVCGPSSSGRVGQPGITTTDNGHRYWGRFGGTSAAAPIVSGVVALMREANTALTWRDVKLILAGSARKNDADNTGWEQGALQYGSTTDRYNFNHEYGFGMVDAKAATDLAVGWTNAPNFREVTSESGSINLSLPDAAAVVGEPDAPRQASTSITVGPSVDFIEFVEVNTHFSHTSFRDLTLKLISPSGAESILVPYADLGERVSLRSAFRFGTARHLGENAAGTWTLQVTDHKRQSGSAQSLRSWGLTIYGHGYKPGPPDIDTVTAGGGTLAVEWKEPTDTGRTAITSYDLRYILKSATDRSDANWTEEINVGSLSNRSYTITGLSGNVEYDIQVRARNSEGFGLWSGITTGEPTIVKPGVPSITNVTRGNRTLAVAWTAPLDNGGGAITAYDVRYIETSADETVESNWTVRDNAWRSGDLTYVISNLTNGTEYDVQVRAVNSAGDGDWSDTETGTPLPDDIPIQLQMEAATLDVDEDVGSVTLTAVFTTTLNAPPATDFEFDLAITTTDLRATQNEDYTPPPSSASFAATDFSQVDVNGQQRYRATRDFSVAIIDDADDESTEDFRVTMNYLTSGLSHLRGGPQSATVTIRDNEHVPVTLSWDQSDVTVDEADGSVTLRAFAVTTVDKRPEDGFSFDTSISTSNGSAVQPGDYTELDYTVTFARGDFSRVTVNGDRRYRAAKQVVITIQDDTVDEIEEDFTARIEYSNPGPPHLLGGPAEANVKIADNDYVPVTISWEDAQVSVDEAAGSVTLNAQSTTTEDGMHLSDFFFDVRVTTRSGSARQNSDYTALDATETILHSDFSPTSINGESRYRAQKQFTIDILDDRNKEGDEVFTVILAYSNPGMPHLQGSSATATITIIDDEDQKPSISTRRPPSTYRENGTGAVYTFRATDPQQGPITWTLEGADADDFDITADSSGRGVLTFRSSPDFENPTDSNQDNVYEIVVVATDEDGLSDMLTFTITITDVNEPPEISRISSAPGNVPENQDQTQVLARYTATDPDNPSAQLTRWSTSGTDGGDFVMNEQGELRFRRTPDFERPADSNRDNQYVFTVRAYDGRIYGNFEEMVTVTPINEPPTITTTSTSATALRQSENRTSRLYTYRATDPERSAISWSVGGPDGHFFAIDERGQFSFKEDNSPNYELPGDSGGDNIYNVTVQATDDDNNIAPLEVTVTVGDVNEGPEVTGGGDSFTVQENRNWLGASFTAQDPEDGSVTRWALGGRDGGDFTIDASGVMTFRRAPDHERTDDWNRDNEYEVEVRPYDGRYYGSHHITVTVEDVTEIIGNAAITRAENFEGTLATYTAGGRGDLTVEPAWRLTGADGSDFTINDRGELQFRNTPDYERPADSNRDNEYLFTVQASDDRYYDTFDVTVTVTPVNEPPTITTTSRTEFTQLENRTTRLYTWRATDPEGSGTITWSLAGVDSRFFIINERGEFSFREDSPPDFDIPGDSGGDNIYNVTVQATDDDHNTAPLDVTVTVSDVNEGPEVTGGGDSFTVQENQEWAGATFTAQDPEDGSVTRWALGGRDGGDFTIDASGVMTFRRTPDHERPDDWNRDSEYEVEIRPYDGRYYGSHLVTVTVEDVTEISGNANITRAENFEGVVATYTAGGRGDLTVEPAWRLTGADGSDFTINDRGELQFRNTPDYERPADSNRDNEYLFTVQASDDRYYDTFDVTVTVTPVNEPPTITTTSRTEFTQPENRTTRLYTWRATDPEGGSTITWSLAGNDSSHFTITQRGEFSFSLASPPDYEQPGDSGGDNVYDVTIQVSDDSSPPNTESLPVTVTVTDVNEGPEITIGGSRFAVQENQDWVGETFTAKDPENPAAQIPRWNLGGRDGGDFTIDENGAMTFRNVPDYERPADSDRNNIYQVEVRPYDGRYYGSHHVTVTVTPINEAPEITTTSRSATGLRYPENRTSRLYTYRATDPERSTVRWSVAGTHARFFSINERGELYFSETTPPDFEDRQGGGADGNVYDITIQAGDGILTGTHDVTVTVTDANEGPEVTGGGNSFTVQENQDWPGASFMAADPEGSEVTRWNLGGRDGGDFTIDENGLMTFRRIPDHEGPADSNRDNIYEVEVRPYDGRYYGSHDVTVTVTPINEAPEITSSSRSATELRHPENRTSRLYTYRATDPEREAITWSVGGTHARFFTINERGELYFSETNPPDYENPQGSGAEGQEYQLTIQASDGTLAGTHDVTVTITDVNEGPEVTSGVDSFTVQENRNWTGASFTASDPEGSTISRWSLGGRDGSDFTITETGLMTFRRVPDHERPDDADGDNIYEVEVRPYDGRYYGPHAVTVTVSDVTEITGNATISRAESQEGVLATYTAGGRGDLVVEPAWRLTGTDGGDFTINDQGELQFRRIPDHERPADSNRDNEYLFTVQATDDRYHGTLDVTVTVTPVNEEPTITTTSSSATTMRHPENRTSRLYTYRATDPEREAITWSVAGTHARFFRISERGELFFSELTPPDFETPQGAGPDSQEYQVTVQASDDDNNIAPLPVTVTVTDVNEGPEISRSGSLQDSVPEGQAQETVLARYTATDPEDPTAAITRWSVSGRDGGDFVINESGELRFRRAPDYERPADGNLDNTYEVIIRASDGRYNGALAETQVITVTNVNEAPAITTRSRTEFNQREYTASVLYTYRATDPDREDEITWSVGGDDGDDFAIYNGVLTFRLLPDYELPADSGGDNEYNITVVAADQGGLRDTLDATVTVTEVNEGPKVSGTTVFTVTEGQDLSGASFTANDQEGDEVRRWSLSGRDGNDFTISEFGEMTFRNLPDYDRPADSNQDNIYQVTVRAYDSGNRYGFLDVIVTVSDVNEGEPVVTGRETLTFRENTTIETRLYTYRATDTDRNTTFTWSVEGDDGSDFAITRDSSGRGELFFRSEPDYEQPADANRDNVYEITVVASDGSNRGELPVTVNVTEVNEGPTITGTTQFTVDERQSITQSVEIAGATFTAADLEGDEVTRWSLTGTDGGDFTITDTSDRTGRDTADLTFRNPPDVDRPADSNRDNEYLVTIRAYDRRGRYGSYDVTVTVTGANEPPVITGSDARTFRENGTGTIYTYRATDPERDEFAWIQPGGVDGHLFDVSERGVLTFKEPPDFDIASDEDGDNDYQVTVRARDDQDNTGTFDVTVTVTDLNEGPTVTGRESISLQEYTDPTLDPQAQVLATYSAVDPEGSDITRWSLSGSDGGDFLVSENGELTFRYAPDYDRPADSNQDNEYLVTVRAYDAASRYGSLEVTVTVGSENEADPVVTGNQALSFRENTPITQRLHTYRATDADRNTTITWSVRGQNGSDDGQAFAIDEGVLTFSIPPNHERPTDSDTDNEYLVEIVATDDQGSEGTLEVAVTVTDVNEGPEPTGTTTYTVMEGQSLTNATFTARDPDPGQGEDAVTGWRLAGPDSGDFNIGPTGTYTAQLTFKSTPDFDRPADSNRDNEYLVTIRAYNGSAYGERDVTFNVTDQNEAEPTLTGRETLTFRENTATDTRLHTYTARDMDLNTEITWSVRGTDGGDFTITPDSSGRGQLFFSSVPNHEIPADADQDNVYDITVVASDGSNEGTLDVIVTVTEVNEGPEVTGQDTRTVAENFDQVLVTYTAVDPEGSDVTRWTLGGSDSGDFTITDTGQEGGPYTAELEFRNPPDHDRPADGNGDNEYLVTIRPYDGRVYGSYDVTITVTSDNEPPVITGSDARTFRENGTSAIYTYRATDPEGDDFTWSVGGLDASRFEISDRGVLTFGDPPDFERPPRPDDNYYQVTVQATDSQGGIGTFDVTVTVTDQNEGPEIAETSINTAITVQENYDAVLATYAATDPEDPDLEITRWSVTGRDGGDFLITENGELTFRNNPDHERPADSNQDNVYEVTVRASDGRYYGTLEVVVTVNAVNEAPEFRSNSTDTFTYQENGTTALYTYRATDPEGSDITWRVTGTDSSAFEISEKGVLSFAVAPDYESSTDSGGNNVYQVTVEARDADDSRAQIASLEVTVTVTNVTD